MTVLIPSAEQAEWGFDMESPAVESRTQELGGALAASVASHRPRLSERAQDELLTRALADAQLRTRLLRLLDGLAAIPSDPEGARVQELVAEHLAGRLPSEPGWLRVALQLARHPALPPPWLARLARGSARWFARRFITPPGAASIRRSAQQLAARGRFACFDVLGEAVLSDAEADAYLHADLAVLEELSRQPQVFQETPSGAAALQLSIKLSSLAPRFTPRDPDGSIERARYRVSAICERALRAGVGVTFDMEQFEIRDLAFELFRRLFERDQELGQWRHAGIVLQAYHADAPRFAEKLIAFARRRGVPFQVRLVKGAYWDQERIVASARRWPAPVLLEKPATDAQFEALTARLLDERAHLTLAIASHNLRAHAHAEAIASQLGLARGSVEHQVLAGTDPALADALSALGFVAREYVPVGELLPGMAYLVRRVLENASQSGFLLQRRSGAGSEQLLAAPRLAAGASEPSATSPDADGADFQRAPEAPWHDPDFRASFEAALRTTAADFDKSFPLVAGGEAIRGDGVAEIRCASRAERVVGRAELAGPSAIFRAVRCAAESRFPASDPEARVAMLLRAADLVRARRAELAAWVVHEGGRDRAGAMGEVTEAEDALRYYAARARSLFAEFAGRVAPRGVTAVISPWNFSLAIPCGQVAAALACGNPVILKPAEQTPLIALRLTALFYEAGVPADALTCLPGDGEKIGGALAADPQVAMVSFVGSRAVGTALHARVAERPPESGGPRALVAEMGGVNPILVFADADLDLAVAGIVESAFGHAGQKCSAASRVIVDARIAERLRERLANACASLEVGAAEDAETEIVPLVDDDACLRLDRAAELARALGRVWVDRYLQKPVAGAPERKAGARLRGPLVVEISAEQWHGSELARSELFGPILFVTRAASEAEAIALANDSEYALTAGLFSRSPRRIARALGSVQAGNLYVNRPITGARVGVEPFGGMRFSGTGPKAFGPDTLFAFVRRTDAATSDEREHKRWRGAAKSARDLEVPETLLRRLTSEWTAPLEQRLAALDEAARRLELSLPLAAEALRAAVRAARADLSQPVALTPVAGQRGELRYDVPRGIGLLVLEGERSAQWLAACLAAGNSVYVAGGPRLVPVLEALRAAGVPPAAMQVMADEADPAALLALARSPRIDFAVADAREAAALALHEAMGPTPPGARGLKALLTSLDGPQPGEAGFARRFAHPRAIAICTLRHGADFAD